MTTRSSLPVSKSHHLAVVLFALLFPILWLISTSTNHSDGKPLNWREKSEPGPDQRPSEWAWLQRTFPYGTADKTAAVEALQQAQAMRRLAKAKYTAEWQFAGPSNVGGRVSDIEFDPQNPEIVYAGAATGGVFKSTDGGLRWTPIFDEQAVLPIGDLAVDPNSSNVIYAGTGESNGGHNNFPGAGIFKSTDAGATWQLLGLETTTSIGRIVVDPSNSQRVFAAAIGSYFGDGPDRGVYRSTDGGQSWKLVLFVNDSTGAIDLVIDPQNPDRLFASVWERIRRPTRARLTGFSSGIHRSLDGGDTWERLDSDNGLPDEAEDIGRIGLAICANQPENLYALYTRNSNYGALYRTKDGGDSWEIADAQRIAASGFGGFSWYFGNVRVHPDDPDRVYVLDISFMASIDGGESWPVMYGYDDQAPNLHVDHHALAFDPSDPQRLLNGNDGGINISQDGGFTWSKVENLPVTQFYHITMDVTNPERLYGGTQDNGTMRTLTGGTSDWNFIYGGDGFYVIVDPRNPQVIYAESQFGALGKSMDGGFDFNGALSGIDTGEPTNWSTPVVMDPSNSNVLYYGTNRVYRTTNAASSWQAISPRLPNSPLGSRLGTVTTIAVAPSNPAVVYAGTDDSQVWVSSDSGKTWDEVSSTLPFRWVTRVAVDPFDAATAYVTFSGLKWNSPQPHVFRTTDFGTNWENISSDLPDAPVNTIVVDPIYPSFLYVGTDVNAYYSSDYGKNWQPLGQGLPMVSVYDLFIHPEQRLLAAGTHGRSMYALDISSFLPTEVTEESRPPQALTLLQNYPNPFNPATTIAFELPQAERVMMRIFDTGGRHVRTFMNALLNSGTHRATWDGTNDSGVGVTSGVYFCRLESGGTVLQRKLVLAR